MPANKNPAEAKKKIIAKWPENFRKKILIVILVLLMMIIIVLWITTLSFSLKSGVKMEKNNKETWEEIQKDINTLFDQTGKGIEQIKRQIGQLGQPGQTTTTLEISPEDIEKLKEKLIEQQSNN